MKIRTDLKAGFDAFTQLAPAGPIWNDEDAASTCRAACSQQDMCANGNWIPTVPGQKSSCSCSY